MLGLRAVCVVQTKVLTQISSMNTGTEGDAGEGGKIVVSLRKRRLWAKKTGGIKQGRRR